MVDLSKKLILIVEDDATSAAMLEATLRKNRVENIVVVGDGKKGWAAIQSQNFDLVLLDWKIPEVSGMTLLNRIRKNTQTKNIPVLVVSSYLENKDFALLEDLDLTGSLEKPVKMPVLYAKFTNLMEESEWRGKEVSKILSMNKFSETLAAVSNSPKPGPLAVRFAAYLREKNELEKAQKILELALTKAPSSLAVKSELGKVLLLKGDYAKSRSLLMDAFEQSPNNLERICALGELELRQRNTDSAQSHFELAEAIDPDDEEVEGGIVLCKNVSQYLKSVDALTLPGTFAGMLNAIGISMVKEKKFDAGIEHYQSALHHISGEVAQSKISFNIGLAFEKMNRQSDAISWFQKSLVYWPEMTKSEDRLRKMGVPLQDSTSEVNDQKYQNSRSAVSVPRETSEIPMNDNDDDEDLPSLPEQDVGNEQSHLLQDAQEKLSVDKSASLFDDDDDDDELGEGNREVNVRALRPPVKGPTAHLKQTTNIAAHNLELDDDDDDD